VTTLSNGQIVLILDMKELLSDLAANADREARGAHSRALEIFG
jgi:chemotaxis protein histidine kinase CheA